MSHQVFSFLVIICIGCGRNPVTTPETPKPILKGVVIAAAGLTLRAEPRKSGQTLLNIPVGTNLMSFAISDRAEEIDYITAHWHKVRHENREGWVFGGYLYLLPIDEKATVQSIYYEDYPGGLKPILILRTDGHFWMQANSCHGLPTYSGKFTTSENSMTFMGSANGWYPLARPFILNKQSDGSLRMQGELKVTNGKNELVMCAPNSETRFKKLFEHGS